MTVDIYDHEGFQLLAVNVPAEKVLTEPGARTELERFGRVWIGSGIGLCYVTKSPAYQVAGPGGFNR